MKRKLLVLLMAFAMLATVLPEHAMPMAMGDEDVSDAVQLPAEEAPEEEEAPFTAKVRVKLEKNVDIYAGDRVTLVADVEANGEYTVSWAYLDVTPAEPKWVELGVGKTYTFEVTEANAEWTYRAVVNGAFASADFKLPALKVREEVVAPVVTEEPAPEPTEEPVKEPEPEATEAPAEEPAPEATEEPAEEPAPEVTEEPAEEPAPEVTEEPAEEPEPEATEEPAEEPEPEATEEPSEEPAPEVTEEPAEEPAPEATEEPAEEPAPEATEEPAEEPEPEATEEPAEEPEVELNPDRDIKVSTAWEGDLHFGDTVTLTAELIGYGNAVYTLQWQTSEDGANWTDVEGATELIYEFTVTEENCQNYWRVIVNVTGLLVEE